MFSHCRDNQMMMLPEFRSGPLRMRRGILRTEIERRRHNGELVDIGFTHKLLTMPDESLIAYGERERKSTEQRNMMWNNYANLIG